MLAGHRASGQAKSLDFDFVPILDFPRAGFRGMALVSKKMEQMRRLAEAPLALDGLEAESLSSPSTIMHPRNTRVFPKPQSFQ